MLMRRAVVSLICLAMLSPGIVVPQDLSEAPLDPAPPLPVEDDLIIIPSGQLPDYDSLRLRIGEESVLQDRYLESLPKTQDVVAGRIVFPEVEPPSQYAHLRLGDLIALALEKNFDLQNAERNVLIARSNVRSADAPFIPYLDLVGESRYIYDRNEDATRTIPVPEPPGGFDPDSDAPREIIRDTKRETETYRNRGGVESGVTLPTGGRLEATGTQTRNDTVVEDGGGLISEGKSYDSNMEVRFIQPLLRGAGPEVAQADVRRARLREMDTILSEQISRRDVVFDVINGYFQLLQTARQLQVSADAIRIRLQFLEDTQVRFDVGRVDESEILRAEIQYLSELETAIGRRRALDDQRENLLLLLGLPMDTPISFVDITETLAGLGRVDIPPLPFSVDEALSGRMELMRQDIGLATAEIDQRVARNSVLPQLDFDSGYNRYDSSDANYSEASQFDNSGWDTGVSFRLPLINIQRREAARRAVLSLEQRRTDREATELRLVQQLRSTHRSVLATEAQLTLLGKNVEQARKNLELINGQFEVGFATVTEVRLAQDDLFAAETRFSNTLLNYQIQLARLYVALGRPLL